MAHSMAAAPVKTALECQMSSVNFGSAVQAITAMEYVQQDLKLASRLALPRDPVEVGVGGEGAVSLCPAWIAYPAACADLHHGGS